MAMIVTTEQDQRVAEQQIALKELQRKQQRAAAGDKKAIRMVKGNKDSSFEIAEHEQHLVHVFVLSRSLSADMQSFNEIKKVITIQPRIFDDMIKSGAFAAYQDAKVVHDPRENAPRTYALKPVEPKLAALVDDADLRAREEALARREEALAKMEERLAKLEQSNASKQKTPPPPMETKAQMSASSPDVTGGAIPGENKIDDLPDFNLDQIDKGQEAPKTKTTGKDTGKQK